MGLLVRALDPSSSTYSPLMDWFKKNPFLATLAAATVVLVAIAGYFFYQASENLAEQEAEFEAQKSRLQGMLQSKVFPDDKNAKAAQAELQETETALSDLAQSFAVKAPDLDREDFQSDLNKKVAELVDLARKNNVALPEDFYLGLVEYKEKPPAQEAVPKLALQLGAVSQVVRVLIESHVRKIDGVTLSAGEAKDLRGRGEPQPPSGAPAPTAGPGKSGHPEDAIPDLVLSPFNVAFTSDQRTFRNAFNRILELKPPVFVRKLAVINSAQEAPKKGASAAAPATGTESPGAAETSANANKSILGRETVTVILELASNTALPLSTQPATPDNK